MDNPMGIAFQLSTDDPEEFQQHMAPTVGPNRVRPARGNHFHISVKAAQFNSLLLFHHTSSSLKIDVAPPHRHFGLNIPLGTPFSITDSNRRSWYKDDAYLRQPDRQFHLETAEDCRILVAGLDTEQAADYAFRLGGSRQSPELAMTSRIPLVTPESCSLTRNLARLWSELQCGDVAPASSISMAEKEDELVAQFILAAQGAKETDHACHEHIDRCVITRAEEYLCAHLRRPVSRAALATECGVTIRTLSRVFTKRWGSGPMGFLKARRMEAVYRELLGASPGETTVTKIACQYGFTHLGSFAGDFKRMFGESPSDTLQH